MLNQQFTLNHNEEALRTLCVDIRELVGAGKLDEAQAYAGSAMAVFPDAPQPHNLYAIVLEEKGNHIQAMKHFRAAWTLDPSYLPARHNIEQFDTFAGESKFAFDEADCMPHQKRSRLEGEPKGLGRLFRKINENFC